MRPVAPRVSLDEPGEWTLIAGQQLVAQLFHRVLFRDVLDVRLLLAGQRGSYCRDILFRQQR